MLVEIQDAARRRFQQVVRDLFSLIVGPPVLGYPPSPEMGEISITSCFDLAKPLRQSPRKIAEQVAARMLPVEGVERISIAGPGYINLHLDRAALAARLFHTRVSSTTPSPDLGTAATSAGKILVEHTSINPNKAAHIGHLRNAVLGDALARLLCFSGRAVEVQNYIDNTGVQVADVVVGFMHLEHRSVEEVRALIPEQSGKRFDYLCWDLYARVSQHYQANPEALALRRETLKAVEEGFGDAAEMAELISTAIVRLHLQTMQRLGIRYDLLVQESEILRLEFWKSAFDLMRSAGAIRLEETGKNRGCWVMSLEGEADPIPEASEDGVEDVKVIVRSNGTVTYVGKDIAYHLWKFALLAKDFGYRRFCRYADGADLWCTAVSGEPGAPAFGHGSQAYAVIDTRQSYLQDVVRRAFIALGFSEQAAGLHHFAYEVVGLSPRCAADLGMEVSDDARRRGYVEVSGRKGLGLKADDLIDALVERACEEVQARNTVSGLREQRACAQQIAVGALRYFLLKVTRRTAITFDLKDALSFEGETGPYLQYTVVRARNILRKFQEVETGFMPSLLGDVLREADLKRHLSGSEGLPFWDLVLLSAQLESAVDQAISAEEPSVLAKYSFRMAQAFNNFYHHYRILQEPDSGLQTFLLFLVHLSAETLGRALD
ncbi:MAG: arginine--tRNA ligase, partial [Terriglobia bacterium]